MPPTLQHASTWISQWRPGIRRQLLGRQSELAEGRPAAASILPWKPLSYPQELTKRLLLSMNPCIMQTGESGQDLGVWHA